ncbi:hypothetical protein AVEN_228356-1 [Araneus ventricosus]|uniref:Uncharacterized protein n=1 Tax=Araneus ventricosus TaxID=182803 RepID=A0A4Y2K7K1_ARAVE|nr:hypothetical protein AVEN_228356-1 [Araneus ventricosus]
MLFLLALYPKQWLPSLQEKRAFLQSRESDADAEMNFSSASEGDTLEYNMSKNLEDTTADDCPPPPLCTSRKRGKNILTLLYPRSTNKDRFVTSVPTFIKEI